MKQPFVHAQMMIRKPADEVFEAFANPEITKNFWFSRGTGRLTRGASLRWHWESVGASTELTVREAIPNKQLLFEWDDPSTQVEVLFEEIEGQGTLVEISNWGFNGSEDETVDQAMGAKGGFTYVLAGAKAWLEHGIRLRLVEDHNPEDRELDVA